MTMETEKETGANFSFILQALEDSTIVEVDWGDGTFVNETINKSYTPVSGTLVGSRTIKIYGEGITSLDCNNNKITALDISNNSDLVSLRCYSNSLTSLDVGQNRKLEFLICYDNQLDSLHVSNNLSLTYLYCFSNKLTVLDLTKNTELTNLECDNNRLSALDVSKDTSLLVLGCSNNLLNELDISKNIKLQVLSCGSNKLSILDASMNREMVFLACDSNQITSLITNSPDELVELHCSNNRLTVLNISNDKVIENIFCDNNKLTILDLAHNTSLNKLVCNNNNLSNLDLSLNITLDYLNCNNNLLNQLDVSNNNALSMLYFSYNNLTFASMPVQHPTCWTYRYAPQNPIPIIKTLSTGEMLDLGYLFNVSGINTIFTWKTRTGKTLVQGIDYEIDNGKTIFLRPRSDSVYCEMTNSVFPDFAGPDVLKTTNMQVTGQETPAITMETTKPIGSAISFSLKARADNTPIKVDFGDGFPVNDTIGSSEISMFDTLVSSQTIIIYGSGITYFNCDDMQINWIYLANDTALQSLSCKYNQLTTLDLSKNPELSNIDCSYNQLISINISSDTVLKTVRCDFNNLTFTTLPLEQASWTAYIYAPQQLLFIVKDVTTGIELDLSKQLFVNEYLTVYNWKTQNEKPLVEGTDYTITNGRTVFLTAQEDSIYCEMTNAAFPAFIGSNVLKTSNTKVKLFTTNENILSDDLTLYSYYNTICIKSPFNAQLTIYDISGRLVMNTFISSGANNIHMEGTGVYLVKLTSNLGSIVRKVYIE